MKYIFVLFCIILTKGLSAQSDEMTLPPIAPPPNLEEANIRSLFDSFQKNLTAKDYEKAFNLLDSATQAFYSTVYRHSIYSSAKVINNLDFLYKYSAVTSRAQFGREKLKNMSLAEFALNSINASERMADKKVWGIIYKKETEVTVKLLDRKMAKVFLMDLIKENGDWRLFETSIERKNFSDEKTIKQYLNGLSETEIINIRLMEISKKKNVNEFWKPIK